MNNEELKELVGENALAIRDLLKLSASVAVETERRAIKLSEETARQIRNVNREIGYIGNMFGRFTEGLFTPSLDRILLKDFDMETVAHRVKRQRNGSGMEVDVLGYSNSGTNTAIVVEIKAALRDADIADFLDMLDKFARLFVEHKGKKVVGMMAAVSISDEQKSRLEKYGIYVVRIKDDVFKVISDKAFEPKDFGLKS